MDLSSVGNKLNLPFGVFELSGGKVVASSQMESILENYGDFFPFLGIEVDNGAYKEGVLVEKKLFLKEEKKSFVFYIQRIEDFFIVFGVDITYNTELIDAIIERSRLITEILSSTNGGIYIKELDGDFVYKNPAFEKFLEEIDYPDSDLIEGLKKREELVNVRKVLSGNREKYILEYGRITESGGERLIRGFVLFDSVSSDFFGRLKHKNNVLSEIINLLSTGVLYFSKDCLSLEYYNKVAETLLTRERIERIKILGFFEKDVLFDENTVTLIKESISLTGKYELFNYKLPNIEGEFDFSFVSGENSLIVYFKKVLPTEEQKAYRQFRSMFEYASDAIFLMKDSVFVACNKKTVELFGCSKQEIIGKTPADFSPEFQPNGMPSEIASLKMIDSATLTGNTMFEWVHKRCDGTLFDAEVTLSKIQIGGYTYTQAIVRDISSRKSLIDLGRDFVDIISLNHPSFVFDENFHLILKNNSECDFTVEEIKKYTISVLTKKTMVSQGLYEGKVRINKSDYTFSVKIFYREKEKYFLVRINKK